MDVKTSRRYDSSGRQEQARRSREAVLDAAERLFLDQGYAATTVAAIANAAAVSVETIYKAFGGKAGVVRAIYQRGLAGRGLVPAYQRSDQMRAEETDPTTIMREWGLLTAEVASQVSPIRLLIRSAALSEPEMVALLKDNDDERLKRMRHHARFLKQRGYLRDGVKLTRPPTSSGRAARSNSMSCLCYNVAGRLPRFAQYVSDFMIATLLSRPEGNLAGCADR